MNISIFGTGGDVGANGCNSFLIKSDIVISDWECGIEQIDGVFIVSVTFVFVFLLPGGRPRGRDIPGMNVDDSVLVETNVVVTLFIVFGIEVIMLVVAAFVTAILGTDGLEFVLAIGAMVR